MPVPGVSSLKRPGLLLSFMSFVTVPNCKLYYLAETPNGFIKQVIGLRQFLLHGLDKVRTEWLWACTAFNIRKLILAMRMLRAEGTVIAV